MARNDIIRVSRASIVLARDRPITSDVPIEAPSPPFPPFPKRVSLRLSVRPSRTISSVVHGLL